MNKMLRFVDLQDLQLIIGILMLGYGLYLVYPPLMFIVIGVLFVAPLILPSLRSGDSE